MKSKLSLIFSTIALLLPLSSAAALVQVKALENSTTGGVGVATNFSIGDLFTITVDPNDLWSAGDLPRWSNANGLTGPDLITEGGFDLPLPGPSRDAIPGGTIGPGNFGNWEQGGLTAPYGTLVGAWGSTPSTFFSIGTSYAGTALDSVLNLYYFDSHAPDNSGSILADINITAVPEPEMYALMLAGLGIVGFTARRRKNKQA